MSTLCTQLNPNILVWARESVGVSVEDAAKRAGVAEGKIRSAEVGEEHLTMAQLRDLAEMYKRPIAFFYLPESPPPLVRPNDYRTHSGVFSRQTIISIRKARSVQKLLGDFGEVANRPAYWQYAHSPRAASQLARGWLRLSNKEQLEAKDTSALIKHLIAILAKKNIQVLMHSFPADEAKAYCLADEPQMIVVSTNDHSMESRVFSVFHELGHLSSGESGICSIDQNARYDRERYCDRFAAEMLMPKEMVEELVSGIGSDDLTDDKILNKISKSIKASKTALLIRFEELGLISRSERLAKQRELSRRPLPSGGGRNTKVASVVKENGPLLTNLVLDAYHSNKIRVNDAARILNINQAYIDEVGAGLGYK